MFILTKPDSQKCNLFFFWEMFFYLTVAFNIFLMMAYE